MTSYRRRGTHAARPTAAPFVAVKRPPQSRPGGDTAAKSGAAGGIRRSGLHFRMTRRKWIAAAIAAGFVAVSFAGGLWSTPSAEPTVQSFLLAWQQGRYLTAAELTTGKPAVVAAALKNAYLQLDAASYALAMGPIIQQGGTARAAFGAWVDLGQNGAPWYYHGRFELRRTGSQWKIVWSPSVINPELHNGLRLAVVSSTPHRALVEDAAGAPLQQPSTAYVAGVRLDRLTRPAVTAARLARVTKLDPSQLLGWILAAPKDSFQELVVLRPGQYDRMASRLGRVPGLIIRTEQLRLFTSMAPAVVGTVGTELSSVLRNQGIAYRPGATVGLSGLQRARQRDLAGTPTIKVVTETAGGRQVSVLASWPGQASRPVRTTIDSGLQTAADAALGPLPQSAAVVAVQASTGRILTVAEHTAPGVPGIDPLAGSYPPGPAFTIVSTEALLASGLRVGTQVPCTTVNDVGGRIFTNVPPVRGSGPQPVFVTDFAHACGTAFSGLSWRLSGHDLTAAASGFGLGAPWQLPLPSFSGSIQSPSTVAALAAGTIGEDGVQVSPLTMALVAGQVDSGTRRAPSLLAGADPPRTPKAPGDPPSARRAWPPCGRSCGPPCSRAWPARRTSPGSRSTARWARCR